MKRKSNFLYQEENKKRPGNYSNHGTQITQKISQVQPAQNISNKSSKINNLNKLNYLQKFQSNPVNSNSSNSNVNKKNIDREFSEELDIESFSFKESKGSKLSNITSSNFSLSIKTSVKNKGDNNNFNNFNNFLPSSKLLNSHSISKNLYSNSNLFLNQNVNKFLPQSKIDSKSRISAFKSDDIFSLTQLGDINNNIKDNDIFPNYKIPQPKQNSEPFDIFTYFGEEEKKTNNKELLQPQLISESPQKNLSGTNFSLAPNSHTGVKLSVPSSVITFQDIRDQSSSTINKMKIFGNQGQSNLGYSANSTSESPLNVSNKVTKYYPSRKNTSNASENVKMMKIGLNNLENKNQQINNFQYETPISQGLDNIYEEEINFNNLEKFQQEENYKNLQDEEIDELELEELFNEGDFTENCHETSNLSYTQLNQIQNFITLYNDKNSVFSFPLNCIIKHDKLNPVQEKCFDLLYQTDLNSVITSPTGSGKTTLFEIAIARVIDRFFNRELNKFSTSNFKIIYLAPIKSLCQEKFSEWKMKFGQHPFGLSVIEATGDSDYINISQLTNANLIISTPERWDIITRKWKETPHVISTIVLLLIDEVHLLNEEHRGATLEAIIARMKLLSTLPQFRSSEIRNYRTIALSATIPNMNELAEFLQVDLQKAMKIFGEEFRPVRIEKHVFGYNNAKNEYLFEKYLNYRLADLIIKYSENRPSLIFCQTQKGTIVAAQQLLTDLGKSNYMNNNGSCDLMQLMNISQRIKDKSLSALVRHGIAFHNGSLCGEDRQLVEENYKKGLIKIICTTSTLAQGVNLPARLVIIKSTMCYRGPKVGYNEYTKMEIDQMIGRAGRPQFDTKGVAIIMTEKSNVDKYLDQTTEKQAIESHLKDNIIEHINAEISQGTITDVESALIWLKNTFMYIRMKYHPEKYNIKKQIRMDVVSLVDEYLQSMCIKFFNDLKDVQLIQIENSTLQANTSDKSNLKLFRALPTSLGKKMSKYYVYFETLKIIVNSANNSEESILEILSLALEFSKYHSKMEDRKTLNQFNKEEISIKYKIKGPVDTANKKANILLQAALSGLNIDLWELRRQQNEIVNSSGRILNCIKEFFKTKNDARGYVNTLLLRKAFAQKMWSDSDLLMKQLPKIGDKIARNFTKAGLSSFEKVLNENPRKLEALCGKNAPFGNVLIDLIKSIPTIDFKFEVLKNFKNFFKLSMTFNINWRKFTQQEDFDPYTPYHTVVIDSSNHLLFKKKLKPNYNNKNLFFHVNSLTSNNFPLQVYLLNDKFFGFDRIHTILSAEDKTGVVNNQNVSCTGQATIYQMYSDKISFKRENNNNVDSYQHSKEIEELDEFIKSVEEGTIDEKPKKKKAKKKNEGGNIKNLLDNMKNFESSGTSKINKSLPSSNQVLHSNNSAVNNQVQNRFEVEVEKPAVKNFSENLDYIMNFELSNKDKQLQAPGVPNISSVTPLQKKTTTHDFNSTAINTENKSEFILNLDFLDSYTYVDQKPQNTKKDNNTKDIKPRSGLNFDDIL
jgi:ATP-dependent DNA helicase HFM1/MER3